MEENKNDMEATANTLEGVYIAPGRMQGNSTRIINNAIELLFKGVKIEIKDHHENGTNNLANHMLADRILRRLQSERLCDHRAIDYDKSKMTIKLK